MNPVLPTTSGQNGFDRPKVCVPHTLLSISIWPFFQSLNAAGFINVTVCLDVCIFQLLMKIIYQ